MLDKFDVYQNVDYVIIVMFMDYDFKINYFNMFSVELVIQDVISINFVVVMIIKFMVLVGFMVVMCQKFVIENIIFFLEFLCEGKVFYDNFYFFCIVIGEQFECVREFVVLFQEGVIKQEILMLFMDFIEVEVIKFFVNIYFVM